MSYLCVWIAIMSICIKMLTLVLLINSMTISTLIQLLIKSKKACSLVSTNLISSSTWRKGLYSLREINSHSSTKITKSLKKPITPYWGLLEISKISLYNKKYNTWKELKWILMITFREHRMQWIESTVLLMTIKFSWEILLMAIDIRTGMISLKKISKNKHKSNL